MKKLLVVLLSVIMVLGLCACSKETKEDDPIVIAKATYDEMIANVGKADVDLSNADGVLASIIEKGVLVVGTSPDYPAAEFVYEATGEICGHEMILAQYIANTLGVELKIEGMEFAGVLVAVDTGKVDLGISGFAYKEDRAENYELSNGYVLSSGAGHHTLLVPASEADNYKSLADFAGKKINAQANSLQQDLTEKQIENADIEMVSSLDQAILNLLSGKVDAAALDATTAKNYAEQSDGQLVSVYVANGVEFDLSSLTNQEGTVLAAKKGETSLIDVVNQIIAQINGTEGLYQSWYIASCNVAGISPSLEQE